MQIHAGQSERWRNECRGGFPVRAESLTVEQQFGVELPWPPGSEHLANGRFVNSEQRSHGAEIRREIHDRTDVEIPVGPAVEPMPNPGR